jgi:hypothetical protein
MPQGASLLGSLLDSDLWVLPLCGRSKHNGINNI